MSELQADGTWGPATWIPELNSSANDFRPSIRHDGLEIFWVATRATVDASWSTPVNVGVPVNTSAAEQRSYLSSDGETLFFASDRPGGFGATDLYVTTRSKERGNSAHN